MKTTDTPEVSPAAPAVGTRLDRVVGRPVPERDIFDYEPGDDDWLEDDATCDRCHGDGTDPWTDHLLPCPDCQWEQRA